MFKVNCPDSTKQTAKVEENKCGTHKTGDGRYVGNFDMGQSSGSFQFEFDTKSEPDSIVICEGKYDGVGSKGNSIYTCPCKASEGMKKRELPFNNQWINVEVIGCTSPSKWEFTINCPKM